MMDQFSLSTMHFLQLRSCSVTMHWRELVLGENWSHASSEVLKQLGYLVLVLVCLSHLPTYIIM